MTSGSLEKRLFSNVLQWQFITLVVKMKARGGSSLEQIEFAGCGSGPFALGEIYQSLSLDQPTASRVGEARDDRTSED